MAMRMMMFPEAFSVAGVVVTSLKGLMTRHRKAVVRFLRSSQHFAACFPVRGRPNEPANTAGPVEQSPPGQHKLSANDAGWPALPEASRAVIFADVARSDEKVPLTRTLSP
jgi:hypothetical protein